MNMRRVALYGLMLAGLTLSLGCVITNYPVITDTRGSYSGVIRTGHKAYIVPSFTVATVWSDGSDELFSMVYQNSYGDQAIDTYNNFDPSASVNFLDQTYCDWRYDGCAGSTAWNPHQDQYDDIFHHDDFFECSGARSHCILLSLSSRLGECGDAGFRADEQDLAAVFSDLAAVGFRGAPAYAGSINSENTSITLTTRNGVRADVPIFGNNAFLVTNRLQTVMPVGPQVRHSLMWLMEHLDQNGEEAVAVINYGPVNASFNVRFESENLSYNIGRF